MDKKILESYNKLVTEINTLQKNKDNPYFKSKYVDLNQILDEVQQKIIDNGFTLLQKVRDNKLCAYLIWTETGDIFTDTEIDLVGTTDMQKLGSAITYARRYSLLPMLQIQCEDDDGNIASDNNKVVKENSYRKSYDDLKTKADFLLAIDQAPDVKHLGALYYKWSAFFKGTPEYKEINEASNKRREELEKSEVVNNLQDDSDYLNSL